MEKKMKRVWSMLLATLLVLAPAFEAAAANQYNIEMEDVAGRTLFPGDSVSGLTGPVYLGDEWTELDLPDGTWTNDKSRAYTVTVVNEADGGGFWMQPAGYVLTVSGGSSQSDDGSSSTHYTPKDGSPETSDDIACYAAWTTVRLQAGTAPDGQVFDHWQTDSASVSFADANAAETTLTMPEESFKVTAVFAAPQTEAPAETQPVTEYPQGDPVQEPADGSVQATGDVTDSGNIGGTPDENPENPMSETGWTEDLENTAETETPSTDAGEAAPDIVIGADDAQSAGSESGSQDTGSETEETPSLHTVDVEGGSGDGTYEIMDSVTITADTVEGMKFAGWAASSDSVWFADSSSAETTFYMPAEDVVVTANYEPEADSMLGEGPQGEAVADLSSITIQDEKGNILTEGITCVVGDEVVVGADEELPDGRRFTDWTVPEGVTFLSDPSSAEARLIVPAEPVILIANYTASGSSGEGEEPNPETQPAGTEAPDETVGDQSSRTETPDTNAESQPSGTEAPDENAQVQPVETENAGQNNLGSDGQETEPTEMTTETPETLPEEETEAESVQIDEIVDSETDLSEAETDMSEGDTELGANESYRIELSSPDDVTVTGGVTDENGLLAGVAGSKITVTAEEYDNMALQKWDIAMVATGEDVPYTVSEDDPYEAVFIMPDSAVYVEPIYEEEIEYDVEVVNGSGSGTYVEGEYVDIEADEPESGYRFKRWTVVSGDVTLDDRKSASTGFTMPAEDVEVQAEYELITYSLQVSNGSGSGSYVMGTKVDLAADYPASGKEFAEWVVTSNNTSVAAPDRYYSSLTMPAADVTLKATYKDGPSPDYNEIQNIAYGGEYLVGQTITFTAVGNGMSNTNPNPGDYRYRPSSYQIGSVTGNWNNSQYTTSMAINAVGQYTLNVTYSKDVFNGESWVADGTYDTKSVSFYVVNALSVQTGDHSPIIPLAVAAGVSLIAMIVLLAYRRRRC